MDPSGTKKKTLPKTQGETFSETPRQTTPGTPKTPGTPRYSKPIDIKLLSPGIYCSSYMLRPSTGVTPERKTLKEGFHRDQKTS